MRHRCGLSGYVDVRLQEWKINNRLPTYGSLTAEGRCRLSQIVSQQQGYSKAGWWVSIVCLFFKARRARAALICGMAPSALFVAYHGKIGLAA